MSEGSNNWRDTVFGKMVLEGEKGDVI